MCKSQVLVADGDEAEQVPHKLKIFRLSPFELWAGYDLASIRLAYLRQTSAEKVALDEVEELPQGAMKTLRIYPNPHAKHSSTFEEELSEMAARGQEFPCHFASRYASS
jgi:hypothetical protein